MKAKPPFSVFNPDRQRIKLNYPAYAPHALDEWLSWVLQDVTIQNVTAVHFICRPDWVLAERHVTDDMFLYVISGGMRIRVDGRQFALEQGDCAHFRRGVPHEAVSNARDLLQFISIHYSAMAFSSLSLPMLLNFPDVFRFAGDREIAARLPAMCREFALRPIGYQHALRAHMVHLLLRALREHGDWLQVRRTETNLTDLHRLLPALQTIRSRLAQPASISALAEQCGYSESQFRRVFVRVLGVRPVQYQRQARMERACQLLRQTDHTVDAIASEVGYAETAFFAHTFKKLIGVPPGAYRHSYEP